MDAERACRSGGLRAVGAGLLAALASCSEPPQGPGRRELALEDLAEVDAAVRAFAADHGGALPESLDLLVRPRPDGKHYLPSGTPAIHDSWGRRFLYERTGAGPDDYRLESLGRDGERGGGGEDADLGRADLTAVE